MSRGLLDHDGNGAHLFRFDSDFELEPVWNIICGISLALFASYFAMGLYWGYKFYQQRNAQVLKSRYSNLTMWEILFILCRITTNFFVILSDLLAQANDHKYIDGATILRQIAFHCGVLFDFATVYTWTYRFWCIFFAMNWTTAAYNMQWQKLIDSQYGASNWYLRNKKKYGNYKYLRKYVVCMVLISSVITIPCRFFFDFASKQVDFIGIIVHGLLLCIPGIMLIVIFIKLPAFEDFIYIRQEMQLILSILIVIYVVCLLVIEIVENVILESVYNEDGNNSSQIKILIVYYNIKELGNFICLYIATAWVLRKTQSLLNIAEETNYESKREIARKTYRPKVTMTLSVHNSHHRTMVSEDRSLLENHLDVFENISNLPMEDFCRDGSLKDQQKINMIQTTQGTIDMTDVLSHHKAFEIFMLHLSVKLNV